MLNRVPNLALPGITEVVNSNQSITPKSPQPVSWGCALYHL
jgi:hypothetical protein